MLFANINLGGLENYSHSGSAGLGRGRREPHGDPLHADQGDSGRWSYDVRWQTNGFQDKYTKYTTTPTKKPFIIIHFIYVWVERSFIFFTFRSSFHVIGWLKLPLSGSKQRVQDTRTVVWLRLLSAGGWYFSKIKTNEYNNIWGIKNKSCTQPSQMIL